MIRIRLEGLPSAVQNGIKLLKQQFSVLAESNEYLNRKSRYIRVYLDVENKQDFAVDCKNESEGGI